MTDKKNLGVTPVNEIAKEAMKYPKTRKEALELGYSCTFLHSFYAKYEKGYVCPMVGNNVPVIFEYSNQEHRKWLENEVITKGYILNHADKTIIISPIAFSNLFKCL